MFLEGVVSGYAIENFNLYYFCANCHFDILTRTYITNIRAHWEPLPFLNSVQNENICFFKVGWKNATMEESHFWHEYLGNLKSSLDFPRILSLDLDTITIGMGTCEVTYTLSDNVIIIKINSGKDSDKLRTSPFFKSVSQTKHCL